MIALSSPASVLRPPVVSAVVAAATSLIWVTSLRPPPTMPLAKPAAVVVTVSPSLAPTWKVKPVAPKTGLPLNDVPVVASTMFLISAAIWTTSAAIAVWSSVLSEPLPYWTLRSRTRCSIECTSVRAPSAVWTSEMPS